MQLELAGKIALVTGASRGIGRAIALDLAREGAKVMLAGRDHPRLEAVAAEIATAGGEALFHAGDLREPGTPEALLAAHGTGFGALDILINNAGDATRGDFFKLSDEDWQNGFALKFFAHVRLVRAAWPMLVSTGGTVLAIVGGGGRTPGAETIIGGAVNASCLAFIKSLAEIGLRDGVQVNAINPGTVQTDRFVASRLKPHMARTGLDEAEALADYALARKITRLGVPEDIGALATFVVSPPARWLHGSIIDMDGGHMKSL